MQSEDTEETLDFYIRIEGPKTNVITMLISYAGAFGIEFEVDAVAVNSSLEKLACDDNGGRIWVLGIMDALRLRQSTSGVFTWG